MKYEKHAITTHCSNHHSLKLQYESLNSEFLDKN